MTHKAITILFVVAMVTILAGLLSLGAVSYQKAEATADRFRLVYSQSTGNVEVWRDLAHNVDYLKIGNGLTRLEK